VQPFACLHRLGCMNSRRNLYGDFVAVHEVFMKSAKKNAGKMESVSEVMLHANPTFARLWPLLLLCSH